ncbi:MAG: alginate export family protein [Polyangiaceae bacterium]
MAVETDAGTFSATPSAEYMLRYRHFEARDFTPSTGADYLRHRARLGLDLDWEKRVGVFVQVQDIRVLGEELDTLTDFDANGFDLHQGYARVRPLDGLELRLGRQEIAYENHRLIGTVAWLEQARAFDGARISFDHDMLHLDAFYAKVLEDYATSHQEAGAIGDVDLLAGNLHLAILPELDLGLVGVLETSGQRGLATFGGLLGGKLEVGFSYGLEGYGQLGHGAGDVDYRSFLLAGHLGQTIDVTTKPYAGAFVELVSGDSDPTDTTKSSFTTLYSTAHKFHGEMDFFLNLPRDTAEAGLLDLGGTLGFHPLPSIDLGATYHHFRAAAAQAGSGSTFGHELDAILKLVPFKPLYLDFVYGLFVPEEIFEETRGDDLEHFIYSTVWVHL